MEDRRRDLRRVRWVLLVAASALVVVLGPALAGSTSLTEMRLLETYAPWATAPPALDPGGVTPANDTLDALLPAKAELAERVGEGDLLPAWDQYAAGGAPLAVTPTQAAWSVLALPYYVLPLWLAPAWVKAVGLLVAAGGTYRWARAVGLSRSTGAMAGLMYATTAFVVVWANWPQAGVAAWLPWLLWSVERLAAAASPSRAVPLVLVLLAMWLEGFPAVVVYGLLTSAVYLLVRLVAERAGARRTLATLATAAAAVLLGTALAAVQLLPLVRLLGSVDLSYRVQGEDAVLPPSTLLTLVFPFGYGSEATGDFRAPRNTVEVVAYVGVVAACLALVAVAARRPPPGTVPGLRVFAVGSVVTMVLVGWVGGPFLRTAQLLPFIGSSFIGRIRSVLVLVLVLLAATGFEVLVRRVDGGPSRLRRTVDRLAAGRAAAVAVAGAVGLGVLLVAGARAAAAADRSASFAAGAAAVLVLAAVTGACVLLAAAPLRSGTARLVALALLPVLTAAQGGAFALRAWGTSPPEQVYPATAGTTYLQSVLGDDRYAAPNGVLFPNANAVYGLRSVTGHTFQTPQWMSLVSAASAGRPQSPTLSALDGTAEVATSPVLDRLGARFWVADPAAGVLGEGRWDPERADGDVDLPAGTPSDLPLPAEADGRALRGVVLQATSAAPGTVVAVELLDAAGDVVAGGSLPAPGAGRPFTVPTSPEVVPAAVRLTADGPVTLLARDGAPLLGVMAAAADGLRLVHTENLLVYRRLAALDRIRWAGSAEVEPDGGRRVARLSAGVDPGAVLLSDGAGGGSGAEARLEVLEDGGDEITVRVEARDSGWLVVADPLRQWWEASVDGRPAELVEADHAVVAVAVPRGTSTVALRFDTGLLVPGAVVSAAAAALLGLVVAGWLRRRSAAAQPARHAP